MAVLSKIDQVETCHIVAAEANLRIVAARKDTEEIVAIVIVIFIQRCQ